MTSTQRSDLQQLHFPGRPTDRQPPRAAAAVPVRPRPGLARLFRGPVGSPPWARPLLWLLLVATAVFYLAGIAGSGYANDFYAAAVKSSTESWKAWLFASLDSGNAITVDKPPVSIWIMGLSGRIFGFSSASMLVPQALMGVGTVALLYASVKRWFGPGAGLVAGALLALTPVAALMFRFNNPDALLVLLMTAAAYCVVRAIEQPVTSAGSKRKYRALTWLLLAGTAIGFAFLTKMLQGLLVLPGFALAYLWASPSRMWTRVWHLLAALGAVIVSAGWFVVLVAVWPASSRPYIGGSTDNSLWELAIGYNGLGRIFGGSGNGGGNTGGGGGGGSMFGGETGLGRMFGSSFGTQISWLIPAALIALVAGLAFTARSARTDRTRAALLLWGGWLLVTGVTFSYMAGTVHPYYSVALAPAIAALVAIGGREMWRGRGNTVVRGLLALMIAVTAVWSFRLMQVNAPTWHPELRWITVTGGLLGAALLAAAVARLRRFAVIGLLVGCLTAGVGMTAWAVDTAATDHTGSTPTAGPSTAGGGRGGTFGGSAGGRGRSFPGGATGGAIEPTGDGATGLPGGGEIPGGAAAPGGGTVPGGEGTTASAGVIALLEATTTRWAAATTSSMSASPYILGSDKAIMAIGGFTGSDPSPTLAQFQEYVRSGQVSYFISGGRGGFGGGAGGSSSISSWVSENYPATTVDGVTVYDLRTATS